METGDVISTLEVEVEIPTQLCAAKDGAKKDGATQTLKVTANA